MQIFILIHFLSYFNLAVLKCIHLLLFFHKTSDEESITFNKMHGFSTVDGFVEITEEMAEMIKYVANEPSVGLFYVQQHTQNAVPNLINLKNNVEEKSRGMTLHTEDLEDSISIVRSMKECGVPIADEMVRDIRKSLAIMSTKQPKKGLIRNSPSSSFQTGRTSSWGPAAWGRSSSVFAQQPDGSGGYLSTVIKSAKERASSLKWPQLDSRELRQAAKGGEKKILSDHNNEAEGSSTSSSTMAVVIEHDELPLSSREEAQEEEVDDGSFLSSNELVSSLAEDFDEFRADREAKLEEWLGGTTNGGTHPQGGL